MTVKLTPKGAATRDRIIAGASAEIRENGVTATLDDIRVRTGTSKSQLFHYFPDGREQLLQCPLSALTTQLGRATPGAQAVVSELMGQWQAEIAAGVRSMQAAGEIAADLDPMRTAAAIVAGIQGGVVMLMSTGDTTPLEAALDLAIAYLQASSPPRSHRLPRSHQLPLTRAPCRQRYTRWGYKLVSLAGWRGRCRGCMR